MGMSEVVYTFDVFRPRRHDSEINIETERNGNSASTHRLQIHSLRSQTIKSIATVVSLSSSVEVEYIL